MASSLTYSLETQLQKIRPLVMSAGEDRFRDHGLLIRAVSAVRDRRPEVRLELASGLPFQAPEGLVTLHTERLNGRIRDVYRRASVAAVALHPTVTGSGLTVVLEAMASGRPVVVTANPGVADYVDHGETGLLVLAGDVDAFAGALAARGADTETVVASLWAQVHGTATLLLSGNYPACWPRNGASMPSSPQC